MSEQEEFTELADADIRSVHAVKGAANGTQWLIAKSADEQPAGLFAPEFVREMIAKADGQPQDAAAADGVTVSGSPGAIAKMIHAAAQRAASRPDDEPDPVAKAKLSRAELDDLPDSAFAYIEPGGHKDAEGKTVPRELRHFAIHDKAHADNAAARIAQGAEFGEQAKAKVEAAQRKFGETVSKADLLGASADPGSPAWEGQDAANAQGVIDQILGCVPAVQRLVQREAAEVGAGHLDDMCDVLELQSAIDALTCAAKTIGAFAVSERAEAGGTVAKAAPSETTPAAAAAPVIKENAVSETQTASEAGTEQVAKADGSALSADERAAIELSVRKAAEEKALRKQIKKAAKAAAAQTSGAAGAPADNARTIPGTDTVQAPAQGPDDVAKAMASSLATALEAAVAPVVKQLGELTTQAKDQQERVEKAMQRPDDRNTPVFNGATGQLRVADRTHDGSPIHSPEFQAVQKALDELPEGEVRDSARAAVGVAAIKARFASVR
jgi:hypothetical protein